MGEEAATSGFTRGSGGAGGHSPLLSPAVQGARSEPCHAAAPAQLLSACHHTVAAPGRGNNPCKDSVKF